MENEFVGSTLDCFKIVVTSKLISGRQTILQVADLLGISRATFYEWVLGAKARPEGMNLMKLRLFLAVLGFRVSERESLSKETLMFCDQMALSLYSIEDARVRLGCKSPQVIYAWINGRNRIKKTSRTKLIKLCNEFEDVARQKLLIITQKLSKFAVCPVRLPSYLKDSDEFFESANKARLSSNQRKIDSVVGIINGLLPLVEDVLNSALPADFERIRKQTMIEGENGVFRLSQLLNRLCNGEGQHNYRPPQYMWGGFFMLT